MLSGLVTRRLYLKTKRTQSRRFPRPSESDPYAFDMRRIVMECHSSWGEQILRKSLKKYKWKDLRNTKAEMSEIQMLRHAADNGWPDKNWLPLSVHRSHSLILPPRYQSQCLSVSETGKQQVWNERVEAKKRHKKHTIVATSFLNGKGSYFHFWPFEFAKYTDDDVRIWE